MMKIRNLDRKTTAKSLKIITHVGALLPLAWLIWDWWTWQLGPNPIQEVTIRTGKATLVLLVLSLACTPANIILGWKQVLPLRRPLGLYAFLYVCLHFLTFVWLDYGLDLALIREAIFEKRYALVGFSAFLILIPLALTSTKRAMRKMGKNWKRLHKWVYLAGILAVIHYLWAIKTLTTEPFIYAAVMVALLLVRIQPLKQQFMRWQRARKAKQVKRPLVAEQVRN